MSGGAESMAAFARRLRVARSTVTRAAQAGRLSLTPEGRVLIAESLARWHATSGGRDDVAVRHAAARGQPIPAAAPTVGATGAATPAQHPQHHPAAKNAATAPLGPSATPPEDEGPQEDPGPLRAKLQAQRWHWRNELLRLEMDLESGARLDRAAAVAEALALGGTLRGAVERLIDQTAPRLAAAQDAAERRRILAQQIAAIRRELRREFPAALRRMQSAPRALA